MDKAVFEKRVFELTVSSLSAASGLIHEPQAYGPLRVMAIIGDLLEILEEQDLLSNRLKEIKTHMMETSQSGMLSDKERKKLIDGIVLRCLDLLD